MVNSTHNDSRILGSTPRPPASADKPSAWRTTTVPGPAILVAALILISLLLLSPLLPRYLEGDGNAVPPVAAGPQTQPASRPATTQPRAVSPHVTRDRHGRLHWPRPRSRERQAHRDSMVRTQIEADSVFRSAIKDGRVLAAMRAVPRHKFVPRDRRSIAYADTPLPIGHGQTISQPFIVALMTELLQVEQGDRILEIGTGSGYQAAVLNELTPYVYTIEIVEPLHKRVVERFEKLGYRTIQIHLGDGYDGWPDDVTFDGIIVTCAAGHVPPPLWAQLKPGGRMVIPIGGVYETQRLVVLTKERGGRRRSRSVLPVRFVPMTGKIQSP